MFPCIEYVRHPLASQSLRRRVDAVEGDAVLLAVRVEQRHSVAVANADDLRSEAATFGSVRQRRAARDADQRRGE